MPKWEIYHYESLYQLIPWFLLNWFLWCLYGCLEVPTDSKAMGNIMGQCSQMINHNHMGAHWFQIKLDLDNADITIKPRMLVGNKIIDHSDVIGASPVGAAPTTSSFWT